jgi:hypothetical protein
MVEEDDVERVAFDGVQIIGKAGDQGDLGLDAGSVKCVADELGVTGSSSRCNMRTGLMIVIEGSELVGWWPLRVNVSVSTNHASTCGRLGETSLPYGKMRPGATYFKRLDAV